MLHNTIKTRLIGGFGLLVVLTILLGAIAIQQMHTVAAVTEGLVKLEVPLTQHSAAARREQTNGALNILGYSFSEDPAKLKTGRENLAQLDESLDKFIAVATEFDQQAELKRAQETLDTLATYRVLVDETERNVLAVQAARTGMDTAAAAFIKGCDEYLTEQSALMHADIAAKKEPAILEERVQKVQWINEVIAAGNQCRILNFRAQTLNDTSLFAQADAQFTTIRENVESIRKMTHQQINLDRLAAVQTVADQYQNLMRETGKTLERMDALRVERFAVTMKIADLCSAVFEGSMQRTGDQSAASLAGLIQAQRIVGIGLFVVAGLAIIIALTIMVSILRPVKVIVDRIKDIAQGEGDLTRRVPINGNDELAELGTWFNTFVEKLHGIISEVSGAVREVASAAAQIAASSEEMSAGMKEQANQTAQVGAAVEEMSATVVEVARKSSDAAGSADLAGKQALDGGDVVRQTIDGINAIATVVSETAHAIEELGQSGEQIGEIIGVINDIADQTNLLALNAAIEAARAGEHGRGFAVVADEVRKLAERTTQATQQVTHSIKTIQTGTHDAVARMNQGTVQVQQGVRLAQGAGDALETIVAGAQQVSGLIQTIAAASEQQSAAAEQISRSIEGISAVTRQSTEGVTQAAAAAHQLSAKSTQLQDLVGQFKL